MEDNNLVLDWELGIETRGVIFNDALVLVILESSYDRVDVLLTLFADEFICFSFLFLGVLKGFGQLEPHHTFHGHILLALN